MSKQENEKPCMKSIKEINDEGYKFIIPGYQRGYRWEKIHVDYLLDDWKKFYDRKNQNGSTGEEEKDSEIYCMQPLVLKERRKENKEYEVIDGQQRLTTTYIISSHLYNMKMNYELSYDTRDLKDIGDNDEKEGSSSFLKKIVETNWKDRCEEDKENEIDYYYMYEAKIAVEDWFKNKNIGGEECKKFLNFIFEHASFVWYVAEESEIPYDVFKRLNIGKIKLTESELVKAMILDRSNYEDNEELKKQQYALEWDEIEHKLQDDQLWLFINNDITDNRPSRIEYILELVRNIDNSRGNKIFKSVYEYFDWKLEKKKPDEIWDDIKCNFRIIEEWYNDFEMYHYVGFLIEEKGVSIENLLKKYKEINSKKMFIHYLMREIKKCVTDSQKGVITKKDGSIDWNHIYEAKSNKYEEDENDLEYENKINDDYSKKNSNKNSKTRTRAFLLLHNIQTIIMQNEKILNSDKYGIEDFNRFPFHLMKKTEWDIEHIRPNNAGIQVKPSKILIYYSVVKNMIGDEEIKDLAENAELVT